MPRSSRIDAPGALHHIIVRGIGRGKIFDEDTDRNAFVERLAVVITDSRYACLAWALIPNHFHLLLRTAEVPLATMMRRLLTGYAMHYNRRHGRSGHLFQNRYKSILCQQEPYFMELVRYIHLNPLRANRVSDLERLDRFPYCGHAVIMGKRSHDWQAADEVLRRYGKRLRPARTGYRDFIEQGVGTGASAGA